MKRLIYTISICLLISNLAKSQTRSLSKQIIKENVLNNIDTTFRIILAPENTYGYEILIESKILIRQLNIPGIAGTKGFKKRIDAEKVAQLVLRKLSKGLMPPTIDDKELRELKIKL